MVVKEALFNIKDKIKKLWFFQIIVGVIFLWKCFGIIMKREANISTLIIMLSYMFLLTGIGNIIFSFGRIGNERFHWGETIFWGIIEIFSGWILINEKRLGVDKLFNDSIDKILRNSVDLKVDVDGYFIMIYVCCFLVFRGISYTLTKFYSITDEKTSEVIFVEKLFALSGMNDFVYGVLLGFSLYMIPQLFGYILFLYLIFNSMILILLGLNMKYTLN